jgi:nucleoside-diphosphate-sugar epimerase
MIAILGATGTIGRSLAYVLARHSDALALFARNPLSLAGETWPAHVSVLALEEFEAGSFDLVINAIGAGDPTRVAAIGAEILDISRTWDERILDTMGPETRYVFLSSGAVHEPQFTQPAAAGCGPNLRVDDFTGIPLYTIAKLQAEARHRQVPDRAILDVRIFGYADVTIPIAGTFFLSELARSIIGCRPFITTPQDMVRDYAGAQELTTLIECWRTNAAPNAALDLYTKAPVSKHELLRIAQSRYGLQIHLGGSVQHSPTGEKPVYASRNLAAAALGYRPLRTAAEVVVEALDALAKTPATGRLSPLD